MDFLVPLPKWLTIAHYIKGGDQVILAPKNKSPKLSQFSFFHCSQALAKLSIGGSPIGKFLVHEEFFFRFTKEAGIVTELQVGRKLTLSTSTKTCSNTMYTENKHHATGVIIAFRICKKMHA